MTILEVHTVQSNAFKMLCDVLKETLNDINIIFDEEGMKIMAMDGSHVALIYLKLYADKFETYQCQKKVQVGLNMTNLFKLMKTITNTDTIIFKIEDEHKHEFDIYIENADKNSKTKFTIKMMDIDEEQWSIPNIAMNSVITMPSNEFQRLCRDMLNISDLINITCDHSTLSLSCVGDFASQETIIGEATHGLSFSNCVEKISGIYSLKYLNLFTKSTNLSHVMELYMKKDFPLILKYNVANLGHLMFCLAPKIEAR